ncbi:hypothetical protein E3O53_01790 [Cryobacterium sp. TMT2-18-3]|uniref:hypothetical protein n=1 Tax=unclassified Cryobacterium TaxID=2649013 RepID=UPI00106D2559|nr:MULTISPECIES: hypothetical protein [unclassified Cryobacterium]TFC31635.1 hypothetical protein E3O22_01930 [Cryobacterium sp. TMT2-18-2]TFC33510.1 hypothetical protein E3O18_13485 [Cryobacterium sp. TMT2-42-4]TFC67702.1 hypothetical protein E3O53_01790 [Cryobacterium sp. TMT2-18-3]
MKLNHKTRFAAVGVVSLALVAGSAIASASAVTQVNGSDAPMYTYDTDGVLVTNLARTWGFDEDLYSGSTTAAYDDSYLCPAISTGASIFLSPVGGERSVGAWSATAVSAFAPGRTTEVVAPTLTPGIMINGTPGALASKASGGRYSLGLACTTNSGVTVVGAFYRTINMTPVTGVFTFELQEDGGTPPPPPINAIALAPTTTAAVVSNGVLALTVPAGAAASFGTPSLVSNKSTTTGTLGNITVNDGRVLTREGWNLSATVADFKNSTDATNIISKSQLGVAPKLVVAGTSATGVTAAAVQVAGAASGTYNFASGSAANTVGDSVLNADLTFVAPQDKAAGTYTSTMTLTVVSK